MEFPIKINTTRMGLSIIYLRGHKWKFKKKYVLQSLKIVSILANSAGLDEMPHFEPFHLGLHFLPKYPFRGFQCTKV